MASDEHTGRKMDVYAWEWLTPNPNGTWQGNIVYQPPADLWGHNEPIPLVRQADALREIERLRAEMQQMTAERDALRKDRVARHAVGEARATADELREAIDEMGNPEGGAQWSK